MSDGERREGQRARTRWCRQHDFLSCMAKKERRRSSSSLLLLVYYVLHEDMCGHDVIAHGREMRSYDRS